MPGLPKREDVLSLAQPKTLSSHHSSHHSLSEPGVSGGKLKRTKGSRLQHALEIARDITLSSGLHTVRGTDSGLRPEDGEQDAAGPQKHIT